ncbi:MAG: GNAT family N-acetyltransferase [Deltaproteobacteria bacterium]|nr:GNAT family N-acetyltransferase [Deltaproteobacteria bacterium]
MNRPVPRIVGARTVLTLPPPAAAPRVLAYFVKNRARLEPVSPPWAEGFFTREYFERRLAASREDWQHDASLRMFLFARHSAGARDAEDGPVVGVVSFTQFVRLAWLRCVLGYSIDQDHEGQGLLREALEGAIAFVFDELRFHRIEANYIPTNERSGNLLRRLGFDVEGYARDYLYLGGRWRDHVLTSKTNPRPLTPA